MRIGAVNVFVDGGFLGLVEKLSFRTRGVAESIHNTVEFRAANLSNIKSVIMFIFFFILILFITGFPVALLHLGSDSDLVSGLFKIILNNYLGEFPFLYEIPVLLVSVFAAYSMCVGGVAIVIIPFLLILSRILSRKITVE